MSAGPVCVTWEIVPSYQRLNIDETARDNYGRTVNDACNAPASRCQDFRHGAATRSTLRVRYGAGEEFQRGLREDARRAHDFSAGLGQSKRTRNPFYPRFFAEQPIVDQASHQ